MSHPLVVHCKKEKYDIYCGRWSKWGNRYIIGKDGNRKEVITKFKKYQLHELLPFINELKGKILGCWCAPKDCHCDILAEEANKIDWENIENV